MTRLLRALQAGLDDVEISEDLVGVLDDGEESLDRQWLDDSSLNSSACSELECYELDSPEMLVAELQNPTAHLRISPGVGVRQAPTGAASKKRGERLFQHELEARKKARTIGRNLLSSGEDPASPLVEKGLKFSIG